MLSSGGLAKRIIDEGIISSEEMQQCIDKARKEGTSLIAYAAENRIVNSRILAQLVAVEFGLPLLDLKSINADSLPENLVSKNLISKYRILPLFRRGKRLYIAMADPTNVAAIDDIKFHTDLNIEVIIADKTTLDSFLSSQQEDVSDLFEDSGSLSDLDASLDEAYLDPDAEEEDAGDPTNDAPVVKFVHKVLIDAIRTGASDIHFEPYEKIYRVRFRTDGILREVASPPIQLSGRLAARLKIISQLDISERRLPQDGRIKLKVSRDKAIDFRVNTLPTMWGEKIVLRILDPSSAQLGIEALGYEDKQRQLYLEKLAQPQGLILVTGPTGSGKTVSLYTGLNILNTAERNISTAEDPVEINLAGINQVQINSKIGLEFTDALRAFLRQDPDVIMVGEIRDLKTAEIAIKAAQTGHLVLSTLHTNSAADTINRLMNMGVPAFNLATAVTLIIAQRLARKLCTHCAKPANYPKETLLAEGFLESELSELKIKSPVGCDKCLDGYKGRAGIFEVVEITPTIANMIMEGANAIQLAEQIKAEGFNVLRRSALVKAKQGVVSLEEVNRITQD